MSSFGMHQVRNYQLNNNQSYDFISNNKATSLQTNPPHFLNKFHHYHKFIQKRMSFTISQKNGMLHSKSQYKDASVTLEVAICLPLFIVTMLQLISVIVLIRFQSNLDAAMHQTAKEMALYGYLADFKENEQVVEEVSLSSIVLSAVYVDTAVKKHMGITYVQNAPIKNLHFLRSQIMYEDKINLVAQYQIKPLFPIFLLPSFIYDSRSCTRAWTGYDNEKAFQNENKEELVYITKYGTVYHRKSSCVYLDVNIVPAAYSKLDSLRNKSGGIYYSCGSCHSSNNKDIVYITDYGSRYHKKLSCKYLNRTIDVIPISKVGERGACSKCG